jgi:hypothetical protein
MKTKHNHDSMKTVVETFLIEETVDLIYDNEQLEKWNAYVQELGLEGQTKIAKKDKSPIPFMHLKNSYVNICKTLCPAEIDIKSYNLTPIPVEILDLVALSIRENYFKKIQVWYDDKSPDPFVVGMNYNTYYSHKDDGGLHKSFSNYDEALKDQHDNGWFKREPYGTGAIYYLIGKWADVKRSWEELKEMATKRFIAQKSNEYHKAIKEAQRGLQDIETQAFDNFN